MAKRVSQYDGRVAMTRGRYHGHHPPAKRDAVVPAAGAA